MKFKEEIKSSKRGQFREKILASGAHLILGKDKESNEELVRKFEGKIAEYCQTKYALGVANGTDALILAHKEVPFLFSPNTLLETL